MVDPRRGAVQTERRSGLTPVRGAVRISRAAPGEIDRVAWIGVESYRDHFTDFWTPAGLEAFLARQFDRARLAEELAGDAVRYDLVHLDDALVGFSKAIRDQPVPLGDGARGFELQKIYFRRTDTGHGLGAQLLAHVIGAARLAGEPCVWLNVLKDNARAGRFYAREGFVVAGEFAYASDRGATTMCVMRRPLV